MLRHACHPAALVLLVATLFATTGSDLVAQGPALVRAHAHNDYAHHRPLLDALDVGCHSVEADVHLVDGRLLVAHDRVDCSPERTLRALYLEPLAERVRQNGGSVLPGGPLEFQLLIDFKTGGDATYAALRDELAAFRPMLSRFPSGAPRQRRAVLAVLSGAAPDATVLADPLRLCALDGWFDDVDRGGDSDAYPLLSARWGSHFEWRGQTPFPAAERARLRSFCARAHAAGRRIRFWAVPNREECWREQLLAGVDWLNVDDLDAARDYLVDEGLDLWGRAALDRLLDDRWGDPAATDRLATRFVEDGLGCAAVERLLRTPRTAVAPPGELPTGKLLGGLKVRCEHVDYESTFLLYLPRQFDADRVHPLFVVGHGGNGAMQLQRAQQAAAIGTIYWQEVADRHGIILAAPLTQRGWGAIGNSLMVSLVSQLERWFHIDPDRVYVTGHSMGGHLSWRTALSMADRFAGVSPMSGGYDYVARGDIGRLWNIPGYATFGQSEPYSIADHNRRMRAWLEQHGYDHWRVVEKPGGHEIFRGELPRAADFLLARPRDPYRADVWVEGNATLQWAVAGSNPRWDQQHTWNAERPLAQTGGHWLELLPRPDLPLGTTQRAHAVVDREAGVVRITSDQVRGLRLRLHPRLIDFERGIRVEINGEIVFRGRPRPDLVAMLDHVRAFDDRGRIHHAVVECAVASDLPVTAATR